MASGCCDFCGRPFTEGDPGYPMDVWLGTRMHRECGLRSESGAMPGAIDAPSRHPLEGLYFETEDSIFINGYQMSKRPPVAVSDLPQLTNPVVNAEAARALMEDQLGADRWVGTKALDRSDD